jgi:hypothetical protein
MSFTRLISLCAAFIGGVVLALFVLVAWFVILPVGAVTAFLVARQHRRRRRQALIGEAAYALP